MVDRRLTLVSAVTALTGAAPLGVIFGTWSWLLRCVLVVGLMAAAALAARTARLPSWAPTSTMAAVLLLVLTWMFPSGHELLGLLPGPATFAHFGSLLTQVGQDVRHYSVPVPDTDALLFVAVGGVGASAMVMDLLVSWLRRAALSGLVMLAVYAVPVSVQPERVPVLPFVVSAAGFMWLLAADSRDRTRRFGRRFRGDGRSVDALSASPLARAARLMAAVALVVAVAVPPALPSGEGVLSRLLQQTDSPGSGSAARVDLFTSLSGSLTQTQTKELLRVTTKEPDPYYLRLGVADVVSAQGFATRPPTGRPLTSLADPRADPRPGVTYTEFNAQVEIIDLDLSMPPVYATPIRVRGLDDWLFDPAASTLFSNRPDARKGYSFDYVRASYDPAALRRAPALDPDSPAAALVQVPEDPFVTSTVANLVRGKVTEYDKVRALYDYLSAANGFSYSLQTKPATSGSLIADFLRTRTGFCQQYAAALAWMVRSAGFPSRVAIGFAMGADRRAGTYTLTNRNAHAWTEVYFEGFGWVPFDATPGSGVPGSIRPLWAPSPGTPTPSPTAAAAPAPNASASSVPVRPRPEPKEGAPSSAAATSTDGLPVLPLVAGLLVVFVLLVPGLWRILIRRRRARDPDPHSAWDELLDTMVDLGVPLHPAETPRSTAARLAGLPGLQPLGGAAMALAGAEERARYARTPLGADLGTQLDEVRRTLARSASQRTRLTASVFPPSVAQRWHRRAQLLLVSAAEHCRRVLTRPRLKR